VTDLRRLTIDGAGGPVSLEIAEAGVGGRPLLLVHGFTGAKEDFGDFVDPLAAAGWHVVAPDQRGHGASDHPTDEAAYSFDAYATDLLGLLDALGWTSAVALGHSMGGMVVQTAALQGPERFEALVLMDTSHRAVRTDAGIVDLAVGIARAEGMAAVMAAQAAVAGEQSASVARVLASRPGHQEFNERKLLGSSPAMYASMISAITDTTAGLDRLPDLAGVSVPTLVIVGEEDTPFLKPSRRMAEAIPGAELAVIPDAAHSPQFENPEQWWKALSTFLARV
jgi:pimeloyl-ACP methyl ester carboxylesterase